MGDSPNPAYRTTIVPILGAGQSVGGDILAMWGRATASDARIRLGSDDVQVTNKSDKVALLPKLDVLNAMARSCILRRGGRSLLNTYSHSLLNTTGHGSYSRLDA